MVDLTNPRGVRTLSAEETARLQRLYPDLPSSPAQCPTCAGQGKFSWWDDPTAAQPMVVEYECDCVAQWTLHRFLLNSGIGKASQQLSWSDMAWCEAHAKIEIRRYIEKYDSYLRNGFGVICYGGPGTGKTALVVLLLKYLLGEGVDGHFVTFSDLIGRFAAGWSDSEDRDWFYRRMKNAGVLVVDDPGREFMGRGAMNISVLDEIVRHRTMELRPTIIAMNLDMEAFAVRYGQYIVSLLHERAMTIRFEGQDRRDDARHRMHDEIDAGLIRPLVFG